MHIYLLILLATGLAMDAFAVSITNGICYRIPVWKNAFYSGIAFGLFQGVMPLIGFLAGNRFSGMIDSIDHWIALILLSVIGGKMIIEARREAKAPGGHHVLKDFSFRTLIAQAVATSIDALAVGVSLGIMQVNVVFAAACIAVITFAFSFIGVLIGKAFGVSLKSKGEILGGIILILIGLRIFVDHVI